MCLVFSRTFFYLWDVMSYDHESKLVSTRARANGGDVGEIHALEGSPESFPKSFFFTVARLSKSGLPRVCVPSYHHCSKEIQNTCCRKRSSSQYNALLCMYVFVILRTATCSMYVVYLYSYPLEHLISSRRQKSIIISNTSSPLPKTPSMSYPHPLIITPAASSQQPHPTTPPSQPG